MLSFFPLNPGFPTILPFFQSEECPSNGPCWKILFLPPHCVLFFQGTIFCPFFFCLAYKKAYSSAFSSMVRNPQPPHLLFPFSLPKYAVFNPTFPAKRRPSWRRLTAKTPPKGVRLFIPLVFRLPVPPPPIFPPDRRRPAPTDETELFFPQRSIPPAPGPPFVPSPREVSKLPPLHLARGPLLLWFCFFCLLLQKVNYLLRRGTFGSGSR